MIREKLRILMFLNFLKVLKMSSKEKERLSGHRGKSVWSFRAGDRVDNYLQGKRGHAETQSDLINRLLIERMTLDRGFERLESEVVEITKEMKLLGERVQNILNLLEKGRK
jgi:hypothetical protein